MSNKYDPSPPLPFLNGLLAAPFTPFDPQGELNLEVIAPYADYLVASRFSGVFICGTAGEAQSLSVTERMAVAEEWMRVANGRLKVVVHVGTPSYAQSVQLAAHAATIGADAISSIPPYFFKPPTVTDLIRFLKPIVEAAPRLPFYYYHFPTITGVSLPLKQILEQGARSLPTLCGVKFTHTDLLEMQQAHYARDGKFEVLCGFDEMLLAAQSLGIYNGVGSTYNYLPHLYFGVLDGWNSGNIEEARSMQQQAVEAIGVINRFGGPTRAGKAAMKLIGLDCGDNRAPLPPFTPQELEELRQELSWALRPI